MINLLPYKEKRSIERIRMLRMASTILIGCCVFISILGVLLLPTVVTINSRFAIATTQIQTLERDGTLVSTVDLALLQKRSQEVSHKLVIANSFGPTDYITLVEHLSSPGILINRFAITDTGAMGVYGNATNRSALQLFIKTLESDAHVSSVQSDVSNFVKATNSPFTLLVSFK